jgi:membrane fusion protein, heavy metal efflux system
MGERVEKAGVQSRIPRFLLLVLGVGVGVASDRLWVATQRASEITQPPIAVRTEAQAALTRVGDRIVVPPGSSLRARLVVEEPVLKEVLQTLVLPAVVEADPTRTVKVLPPVAGRLLDLKVQLGGRVVQGQELAVIDSSDLAQAYADADKARSTLKLTKQTLDRLMLLEKTQAISVKEREQAQSDFAQAQAELERAESRLRAIGVAPDQRERSRLLSLKAAISGSVIDLQVAPGAFLNDPTAAIMTLANLDKVWVTANVPEKDISFVSNDQDVSVIFPAYPGKTYAGKVLFISDVLEPDTRRNKVRIVFENGDRSLKLGMFANATFAAPMVSRLVVPTSALLLSNDRTSVFVEVASWTFERREVMTDYQEGDAAAIRTGLSPGERVIVKGGVILND